MIVFSEQELDAWALKIKSGYILTRVEQGIAESLCLFLDKLKVTRDKYIGE